MAGMYRIKFLLGLLLISGMPGLLRADSGTTKDRLGSPAELAARQIGAFTPCQLTDPHQVQSFAAECLDIEIA